MSSFESLWNATIAKFPNLSNQNAKVTITVAQFKKALRQDHESGYGEGVRVGKNVAEYDAKRADKRGASSLLDSLFGDKFR